MAIALYRRYRPETFAEMIGQSQVTEPIMTALRSGNLGHAYLFSGPRGCGKTTSARVLARCLNCAAGPTDTPCGTCASCVELSRDGGGSLDVIEIDAASHGGVDDARDLRERAIFAPVRDRYKIFIIDEAHMVSKEGFNALLKIVEEPPEHVKFVFATTEPEKVIGTIRSRTHHYPFRLIAPAALLEYVQRLCTEEGIEAEEGVLPLVIRAGGGSARDTLSILDQLIAGSEGSRIQYERAVGLLGYTHEDILDEVVNALGDADPAAGVHAVDRVIQTGQDPRRFVEDLLERLRDLIIVQATDIEGAAAVLRGIPEEQLERMVQQASKFQRGTISRVADIVSGALDSMTGATAPRLHLELMIARVFVELARSAERPTPVHREDAPGDIPQVPRSAGQAEKPAAASRQRSTAGTPIDPSAGDASDAAPNEDPARQGESPEPVNPAQAMRSARAFLAGHVSGAAEAHEPRHARPADNAVSAQAFEDLTPADAPGAPASSEPVSSESPGRTETEFDTRALVSVWPTLAQSLEGRDPQAAHAAQEAEVLGLDGVTVHVGFRDAPHLETFKALCAAPIRSGLQDRFGVTIGFQPWVGRDRIQEGRQLFGGSAPAAATPRVSQAPDTEPPVAGPPETGSPEVPSPERARPEASRDEAADRAPRAPRSATQQGQPHESQEASARSTQSQETPRSAPSFTRYGEAVVREVLGAKFVGEQPLP